jgi:hypothetical protein
MLGAALALTGCQGSSEYMQVVREPKPITAPSDKAVVVFLRPAGLGFAINFAILDQRGNWLGDSVAQTHFSVALPPGEYLFVAWAENTAALKATLTPGRVYAVEVIPTMGFGSARVIMEALTPRHEHWPLLGGWLQQTATLEPLPTGVAHMQQRHDDAVKRVASAQENWAGYSDEDKALRTLRAEDGVLRNGAAAEPAGGATPLPSNGASAASPAADPEDAQLLALCADGNDGACKTLQFATKKHGCCTGRGGARKCDDQSRVVCMDGTPSATCLCTTADPALAPASPPAPPAPPPPPTKSAAPRPPATPPSPAPASNCKQPTWTDDSGHVHLKPGCV